MAKTYKNCEISQQLDYMSEEDIIKGLDHNAIKDYAYILHDKDVLEDGTPKKPHWHIMIRFKNSVPDTSICNWFNIKPNYIENVHTKFDYAIAYLTHKIAPNKYQYLEENVKSNFDFKKAIEKVEKKKTYDQRRQEIIEQIQQGIIREYNYTKHITAEEYDRYKRNIDNAFKYRIDALEGVERNMECIFIYGDSGAGKTTYAKQLAENKGYSYYVSSGSNDVLDNYKGQDCIILDDLRPSCMNLSDLLKMLDNHTASTVKSRFKNKVLECKMIIITTTLPIDTFFNNVFSEEKETVIQLKRRCKMYIHLTVDKMYVSLYQEKSRQYMQIAEYENPIALQFKAKDMTQDEALQYVENFLGETLSGVKKIRENQGEFMIDENHNIVF